MKTILSSLKHAVRHCQPRKNPSPARFILAQGLGSIVDGLTCLILAPFGRTGTGLALDAMVARTRWYLAHRKPSDQLK